MKSLFLLRKIIVGKSLRRIVVQFVSNIMFFSVAYAKLLNKIVTSTIAFFVGTRPHRQTQWGLKAMTTAVNPQIDNCNFVAHSLCDILRTTKLHYQWQQLIALLGQSAGILALNIQSFSLFFVNFSHRNVTDDTVKS